MSMWVLTGTLNKRSWQNRQSDYLWPIVTVRHGRVGQLCNGDSRRHSGRRL